VPLNASPDSITPRLRGSLEPNGAAENVFDVSRTILCACREQERRTVLDERTDDPAIGDQMQVGVAHLRPTDLFGP